MCSQSRYGVEHTCISLFFIILFSFYDFSPFLDFHFHPNSFWYLHFHSALVSFTLFSFVCFTQFGFSHKYTFCFLVFTFHLIPLNLPVSFFFHQVIFSYSFTFVSRCLTLKGRAVSLYFIFFLSILPRVLNSSSKCFPSLTFSSLLVSSPEGH